MINHIDDCIAGILDQWLGYGSPESAEPCYVLFSSDHREMLGYHQLFRKSLGYEGSARVPFFISGRNVPIERKTTSELVCWEDIAPTLLDLAGIEIPPSMRGRSLAAIVRGASLHAPRNHIFGQCEGDFHNLWIVTERWKYLWFPQTNEEQLFDLVSDPHECYDRSGNDPALVEMRALMAEHIRGRHDLCYELDSLKPCGNNSPQAFWP